MGVLRILSRVHRTFSDDEIEFASALTEQAAMAIEYARTLSV